MKDVCAFQLRIYVGVHSLASALSVITKAEKNWPEGQPAANAHLLVASTGVIDPLCHPRIAQRRQEYVGIGFVIEPGRTRVQSRPTIFNSGFLLCVGKGHPGVKRRV